jgi:hypothetical protein
MVFFCFGESGLYEEMLSGNDQSQSFIPKTDIGIL